MRSPRASAAATSRLSLLERLEALCGRRLTRIGLSATQKPIDEVGRFLVGSRGIAADAVPDCAIVDIGHARARDLAIEVPAVPLSGVMSNDVWDLVYARLAEIIKEHRTTLIFVNTRRMAERAARHLSELLGREAVAAHHGSLAREHRLDAEQRLQAAATCACWSRNRVAGACHRHRRCSIWSASSLAALDPRYSCTLASAASDTPSAARRRGACSRSRATISSNAPALLDCVRRGELDTLRNSARATGRARAADRRRSGQPRMRRGRTLRSGSLRISIRATRKRADFNAIVRAWSPKDFTTRQRETRVRTSIATR